MCTRIFWGDNPAAKVVSRTMDWAATDEPKLWALPAGLDRGYPGTGVEWTSKYPSVVKSMWDSGTVDGMNDQGLAAHLLYLDEVDTGYSPADTPKALPNILWAQYVLDTSATVAEALENLRETSIVSKEMRGAHMGCHLSLEDASGDSAIVEPLGGELVVHHGREFKVMANSPTYDEQLANLARYRPFGGELPPPGDITSADRFVRASYFLHYLPEPADADEALARVVQLATNAAVPAGSPYSDGGVYPTWWIAAADLTNLGYYHWSMTSPELCWVELPALANRTEVGMLDLSQDGLGADLSGLFTPATLPY